MGSGVAGALRRAAGGPIHEAAVAKGPIEFGEVAVTDAFDLDADYVIHAAAMPYYGDGPGDRGDTGQRPADAAGTSHRTYRLRADGRPWAWDRSARRGVFVRDSCNDGHGD